MKIYEEMSLEDFDFWSGAKDLAEKLTSEEFKIIESILEDMYPEGIEDVQLNDTFWYEGEMLAEWCGTTEEEILNRDDE